MAAEETAALEQRAKNEPGKNAIALFDPQEHHTYSWPVFTSAVLGEKYQALIDYSRRIGIAFQIADDILDVEGNQALVGKTLNKDAEQGKITFVGIYGLSKAKQIAKDFIIEAEQVLDIFGNKAQTLKELAHFIIERKS